MATYYVYSGAGGSGTGATWANAFTTLTLAFVGKAAGDVFYVAHDHAEVAGGNLIFTTAGTVPLPVKVICVNRAGSVPPVSADRRATATVTSGANITFNAGAAHWDGIIIAAPANINLPNGGIDGHFYRFDNCSFQLTSAASHRIFMGTLGVTGILVEWNNTTLSCASTGHGIEVGCQFRWRNTPSALIGTAVPTTLFRGAAAEVECIGVDFSAAGSGKTIVLGSSTATLRYSFLDCKLNASVTKSAVPGGAGAPWIDFVRSGSSAVNYTVHSHRVSGLLTEETTIVRTGGASDGTTPLAWKIVTTANCLYSSPFECPPIAIWNDTTGASVMATVEGIWGGGSVPNDDDIWLDVEYLGDASSPQGSFVNDGKADLLATATGQTSSSETWGGSTTKFKLVVSFTPQQKGWIYARVKCAKASSTFYVDPVVTLT